MTPNAARLFFIPPERCIGSHRGGRTKRVSPFEHWREGGKIVPKKEKVELVCREQADLPRSATSGFPSGSPGRFVRAISRAVERSIVFTLFL